LTVLQRALRDAAATVTTPLHSKEASAMNKDIISGKWSQLKGKAQAKWGELTDDVFDVAEGDGNYLAGKLQERYGIARDAARKQVEAFNQDL
jgi:uncharacterized protein YjbJ (UPF0337 family)